MGENVEMLKSLWDSEALDYAWIAVTRLLGRLNVDIKQWSEEKNDMDILRRCCRPAPLILKRSVFFCVTAALCHIMTCWCHEMQVKLTYEPCR